MSSTFPPNPPPDSPLDAAPLPCLQCHYNLTGLESLRRCPECQFPIEASRNAAAFNLLIYATALLVAGLFSAIASLQINPLFGPIHISPTVFHLIHALTSALLIIATFLLAFMPVRHLSVPLASLPAFLEKWGTLLRIIAAVCLALSIARWAVLLVLFNAPQTITPTPPPPSSWLWSTIKSLTWMSYGSVMYVTATCSGLCAASLALSLRQPALAKLLRVASWAILPSGIVVITLFHGLYSGWITPPNTEWIWIGDAAACVSFACLLALLLWLVIVVRQARPIT
jgi:hypothetical protein